MSDARPVTPDLVTLASLFYPSADELAEFVEVAPADMPPEYRRLLAHNNHMTVTVEAFHGSPVDVVVLDKRITPRHYARKILLARQSDGVVVQFGIMRVTLEYLSPEIRAGIESESIPLGRLLVSHDVLREVELVSLRKVDPGDNLRELLGTSPGQTTYGRTALIHVAGEPAVELLEIVTPI